MSIRTISTEQLRRMGDQEGLILQGCGGDPQEWVDGINQIFTEEGILKKGAKFEEAYTFRHEKQRNTVCIFYFHTAPGKQKIADQPQTIYSEFP